LAGAQTRGPGSKIIIVIANGYLLVDKANALDRVSTLGQNVLEYRDVKLVRIGRCLELEGV
jgi:hypothetical protein